MGSAMLATMTQRVLVIGADAAGMSAAHQALRTARANGRELRITALEASGHTSYSACGLPYWVAGEVAGGGDALVARTAEQHRAAGIDLRLHTRAVAADLGEQWVEALGPDGVERFAYDDLVVTTGARAIVPDWARDAGGGLLPGVGPVHNLDDGAAWLDRFATHEGPVAIVGGGYIGVEMAEAAVRRGFETTLITRRRVLRSLGEELSQRVAGGLRAAGVTVVEDGAVEGLELRDARVSGVAHGGGSAAARLVVLALGVRPATDFLEGQAPLTDSGALRPDGHGRVGDGLWAAGDCCEVRHRLSGEWAYLPLGTHATKHGRALGDSLAGGGLRFDGALGTTITRFAAGGVHLEISCTGLSPDQVTAAGGRTLMTEGTTASGYLSEAEPIAIEVAADPGSRRLLAVRIVGGRGAGKRVDAAAAVLWAGGTVDDLAWMDLSYAPPFATAWEILQVAARRLAERL